MRVRLPLSAPPGFEFEAGLKRLTSRRRACFPGTDLTGKPTGNPHPETHLRDGGAAMCLTEAWKPYLW